MLVATVALFFGFLILIFSSSKTNVISAYLGFISILIIWSWLEVAFLLGWITGNRRSVCPKNIKGFERAWLAFQTISYHEFSLLLFGGIIFLATFDSPNQIGITTYLVLWVMRISSKLNVFLGVRNFYEEFLPKKISYLTTYFKKKSFNPLLPIILFFSLCIDMLFWYNASYAANSFLRVSNALLASLLALGIIEHIFMVLPFQLDRIWRLGLSRRS